MGPRPPLVTDEVEALVGHEAQRGEHVRAAVADDRDVREVDAEPLQAVGEPRAVAVGDAAGEHLGAGDDDPGTHAPFAWRVRVHLHVGCSPAVSERIPVAVMA